MYLTIELAYTLKNLKYLNRLAIDDAEVNNTLVCSLNMVTITYPILHSAPRH